eukprot:3775692-Rhodomonas_salina.1
MPGSAVATVPRQYQRAYCPTQCSLSSLELTVKSVDSPGHTAYTLRQSKCIPGTNCTEIAKLDSLTWMPQPLQYFALLLCRYPLLHIAENTAEMSRNRPNWAKVGRIRPDPAYSNRFSLCFCGMGLLFPRNLSSISRHLRRGLCSSRACRVVGSMGILRSCTLSAGRIAC